MKRGSARNSETNQIGEFLYQLPENLNSWGFPTGRKCDSMQHVVNLRSGQHVSNRDYALRSEYFAVAGGGGADG